MSLPDDISRCKDKSCPYCEHCLRYTDRPMGRRYSITMSLRDEGECKYIIPDLDKESTDDL